mgnify:FL=1
MKKIVGKMLILTIALLCTPITVMAQENTVRVDAEEVLPDGKWQDYNLGVNEYVYCPIVLESNGRLDVSVQTNFINSHYVYLLDENYETIAYNAISGQGEAAPQTQNYSYDLAEGEYYIRVESWNECQGKFRIKAEFLESTAKDENKNTDFQNALLYKDPQVTGFLSSGNNGGDWAEKLPEGSQNFEDYYKLEAKEGTYNIRVTGADPEGSFECVIYDSGYMEMMHEYQPTSFSADLKDGIYYVKVVSSGQKAGDYILRINNSEEDYSGN